MHPGIQPIIASAPPIEIRATNTFGTAGSGSTTIAANLPASIVAGELLLLFVAAEDAAGLTVNTPAGWTPIPNLSYGNSASTFRRLAGFYRVADGSEGATVSVAFVGGGSMDAGAAVSMAVKNYQGTPESSVTPSAFNSSAPDPTAITPSWGTASKSLFLSVIGFEQDAAINAAPTGYTLAASVVGSTNRLRLAVYYKIDRLASDDPAAYTLASAQTGWTATAAVRGSS